MSSPTGADRGPTAGVVLCGGGSVRMGRDKAMLPFGSMTMLEHVLRAVSAVSDQIIVVAAPTQQLPRLPETVQVIRDPEPDIGPLAGLLAALESIGDSAEIVTLCGCDTPLLRPEFLSRVMERLEEDHDAALPVIDSIPQPLAGVYRTSLLPVVQELRNEQRRSLRSLLDRCRWRGLDRSEFADIDPDLELLTNVNTPDDYDRVRGRSC